MGCRPTAAAMRHLSPLVAWFGRTISLGRSRLRACHADSSAMSPLPRAPALCGDPDRVGEVSRPAVHVS